MMVLEMDLIFVAAPSVGDVSVPGFAAALPAELPGY